jgi:ligand-binding sensor domain-containing protein
MFKKLIFTLIISSFLIYGALGQDSAPLHKMDHDQYITDWLVLGPFFPRDLDRDFLADSGGETNIYPKEGDKVIDSDGRKLTWKRVQSVVKSGRKADTIDLLNAIGNYDNATAYAFCILETESEGSVNFYMGSDDGIAAWINGEKKHFHPASRFLMKDQDVFKANLKVGYNRFLIKVSQGTEAWGFAVRADIPGSDTKIVNIEGKLLMLDDKTPHEAVVVQAVAMHNGKYAVADTALSHENGYYKFVNMKPGRYVVRCYTSDGYIYYKWNKNEPVDNISQATPLRVQQYTKIQEYINFRFAPFGKGTWNRFDNTDGLADNRVKSIYMSKDGYFWIGTESGVSRFDGAQFINYSAEHKLPRFSVRAVYEDKNGFIWLATDKGVFQFNGLDFVNYTVEDGLAHNSVFAVHGDDQGKIWFGTRNGVSMFDGSNFVNYTKRDGLADNEIKDIYLDKQSRIWLGTQNGVSRFDGNGFITYNAENGLIDNHVLAINEDHKGNLWFGTIKGISRFDGELFANYTTEDGTICESVSCIYPDRNDYLWFAGKSALSRFDGENFINFPGYDVTDIEEDVDGNLWLATSNAGMLRFDPYGFISYDTRDGLPENTIRSAYVDNQRRIWFGTATKGVSYFDGKRFTNFPKISGVLAIVEDSQGNIWLGSSSENGVFRYDGETFVQYTERDGFNIQQVHTIWQDSQDNLWFGGDKGICRYDGREFIDYTDKYGFAKNEVRSVTHDAQGHLWFGTNGNGVFRFDGDELLNYTIENRLVDNRIMVIHADQNGHLWFGAPTGVSLYDGNTFSIMNEGIVNTAVHDIHEDGFGHLWFATEKGVIHYDGNVFQNLNAKDGIAGDYVYSIDEDRDGFLWFATDNGVTRYIRDTKPPQAHIIAIIKDESQIHPENVQSHVFGDTVSLEYGSVAFDTQGDERLYQYKMLGYDTDWGKPTRATRVEYQNLRPGEYTFQVRAIDRDLNYSNPSSIKFTVSIIPFYRADTRFKIITGVVGVLLLILIIFGLKIWASRRAEKKLLRQELEKARQMQTALLPETSPQIDGFDIFGFSRPAQTVGGDFFDYLNMDNGRFGIALADASDRGLEGAENAVLTDRLLREVAKNGASCGEILSSLNADLHPHMQNHTFTAVELAIIDKDEEFLQWSNAAQPYPIIKRNGRTFEIGSVGELPLGVLKDTKYPDWEMNFHSGDIVVFYTNGVIKSQNKYGEVYGIEGLEQAIRNVNAGLVAKNIAETLMQDILNFTRSAEQYDDIIMVVIKKL